MDARINLSLKHLKGKGVEFGALHNPLPVNPKQCQVCYVDRLATKEVLDHFPELRSKASTLVPVSILLDINQDDFSELIKHQFDFFVANHLIEHLINPIRFLENIYNVMPSDSVLYLAVPDKDYTFDRFRDLTTNDHLWQEYKENINELSVEHLNDFILNITKDHIEPERRSRMYFKNDILPVDAETVEKIYQLHRDRSIHVHVWNQNTFNQFLKFVINKLNLDLEVIDSCESKGNSSNEMIYILRKHGKKVSGFREIFRKIATLNKRW